MVDLVEFRTKIFSGPDAYLYLNIGYFIAWFTRAELSITYLIAIVSKITDYEAVDVLTKGMDARVKVVCLRELCRKKGKPIGKDSNLGVRLAHFQEKLIPIRNDFAHNAPSESKTGIPRIYLWGLDRLPEIYPEFPNPSKGKPKEITYDELFHHSLWLNYFTDDLIEVQKALLKGQPPEIVNPRSTAPLKQPPNQPKSSRSAKPRKPEKK